ncbi:efflux transporter periplasmic adaptor subunit [Pseudorhodobacter sp. E13]|uniref:efflux RND transporter periplasmic adaptor subunit n=1 Tax=Pseudorhodobacter sp. E13 TaxID=2487931 RepID=UPI000F8CE03B|nr:HlyD family efflux transporter periplasmic adaptor subunit [Pseudorhodobacter sp. E13]RUS60737.1 efflux transporter periplasmic adaptor subunit [Pseudorhodobacter sp. E13]
MRFFRRSLIGLLLVAVTLGLLAMAGQTLRAAFEAKLAGGRPGQPARERVFSVNLVTAEAVSMAPTLTAFGEIRSRRTLELRSPRAGTVIALGEGVEDGATVTAGQLLLRLDPADATTARDLAQSDLARAQGEARDADRALALSRDDVAAAEMQAELRQQALDRQRDLEARGVGSTSAVETAALAASSAAQALVGRRTALAQAEARVDQAATALSRQAITLAEAERALAETELFAEFDGVLSGISTVPGRILGANERIGDLIDPNALEVAFRISTAQFLRLIDQNGRLLPAELTAALEVSGAEIIAQGALTRVGAAVGEGQTGRLIYATLRSAPGFRPGDFVTVRISEPVMDNVVALPATALGADGTVLALTADDRLEAIPVTLLRRQGDAVILSADAIAGRELVQELSPLLGAGIKVKPVRAADAATTDTASAAPVASPVAASTGQPDMVSLTPERRAALVAFVEGNDRMPAEAKSRLLAQLAKDQVPAGVIERLESRMGG